MGTRSQGLEGIAGNGFVNRPAHIFQQVEFGGIMFLLNGYGNR